MVGTSFVVFIISFAVEVMSSLGSFGASSWPSIGGIPPSTGVCVGSVGAADVAEGSPPIGVGATGPPVRPPAGSAMGAFC